MCNSRFQEVQTARLHLDEDEPALIARLIAFAYTSTYHTHSVKSGKWGYEQFAFVPDAYEDFPDKNKKFSWLTRAKLHTMMYSLGDKYDVPTLKRQSLQRFVLCFQFRDEYSCQPFEVAHEDDDWDWADFLGKHPDHGSNYAQVLELVYSTTPAHDRGLRDIVLADLIQIREDAHLDCLQKSRELMDVISGIHQLTFDFAMRRFSETDYKCNSCGNTTVLMERHCYSSEMHDCQGSACAMAKETSSFCGRCLRLGSSQVSKEVLASNGKA